MNYKAYLYIFFIIISTFCVAGMNINKLFKTNKIIESKIFVILLSIIIGYLVTNFVTDFIEVSKII